MAQPTQDPFPAHREHLSGPIALIGFGEAGAAFVAGWRSDDGPNVSAFDIKTDSADDAVRQGKWNDYARAGVMGCGTIGEAVGSAAMVFSLVTPDQARVAAQNAARHLQPQTLYLDCNSCAPSVKREAAALIDAAGGRTVDVAVMAPVGPALHRTPLLVSGPHADAALTVFTELNMRATAVAGDVGAASSIKMIRSVVIKGLEAVVLEAILAGRKAGVAEAVLHSLEATHPGFGWHKRAGYMLERVATHGTRRAAEMREVAHALQELGLHDNMSQASSLWQARVGALGVSVDSLPGDDLGRLADAILAALEKAARSDTHEAAE